MNFTLKRIYFGDKFTVGHLILNDEVVCLTLEDKVREIEGQPVGQWKIPHVTAIPKGTYQITQTFSPKFGKVMPLLNNVSGYEGVRIHTGNSDVDTDGCILVGTFWDGKSDWISGSRDAFSKLLPLLGDESTIEVC